MLTYNLTILAGNITKDVELKTTPNGTKFTNITLAVKKNKEETLFIDCTAWKEKAEFIYRYFHKGSNIFVAGLLNVREYESNGKKYRTPELLIQEARFVDDKEDKFGVASEPDGETKAVEPNWESVDDDDLPF